MTFAQYIKDPNATLDYSFDWSLWLGTDTITASVWTVAAGLTEVTSTITGALATVWLSGGTAGVAYTVSNRITTAAGRIEDRSMTISVVAR